MIWKLLFTDDNDEPQVDNKSINDEEKDEEPNKKIRAADDTEGLDGRNTPRKRCEMVECYKSLDNKCTRRMPPSQADIPALHHKKESTFRNKLFWLKQKIKQVQIYVLELMCSAPAVVVCHSWIRSSCLEPYRAAYICIIHLLHTFLSNNMPT